MKLKEKDFNLIKIKFEFKNQIVIIKTEPYKIFEEIKYKVLNKFIDIFSIIPNNLHFYYLGKDLFNYEKEKIGDIFNHKENITILLRLPKIKFNCKLNNYKKELSSNDKYIINKEKDNINYSLEKTNYNKNKKNKSYYNLKTNEINKLSKSNSMRYLNSEKKVSSMNKFHININDLGNFAYCERHKYKVSEYCRICKKFICQECRYNQLHKDHLTIQLNLHNLEESIKLYIMLLQINEKNNIKKIKDGLSQQKNDLIDDIILSKKEEDIMEKFDKIIKNYHSFMNKIDKKTGNDKKKYRLMVINNFNDVALRINMQINTIINKFENDIKNKDNNFSLEELQIYLDEISKKEETLELIRERTIKYLLSFEINNQIENTFNKIETTLDEINNEINPFSLDEKYNKELMKIINIENNNIENNDINEKKQTKSILKKRNEFFSEQ